MLIGLPRQHLKIFDPALSLPSAYPIIPCASTSNLCFIFGSSLHCKTNLIVIHWTSTCHYHVRHDFCRTRRHTLDFTTVYTFVTSFIHSRLDYCNYLYHSFRSLTFNPFKTPYQELYFHTTTLRTSQYHSHFTDSGYTNMSYISHITTLSSLQHYSHISGTRSNNAYNKIITVSYSNSEPTYLCCITTLQFRGSTRSAVSVFILLAPLTSKLKFSHRSFRNFSPIYTTLLPIDLILPIPHLINTVHFLQL